MRPSDLGRVSQYGGPGEADVEDGAGPVGDGELVVTGRDASPLLEAPQVLCRSYAGCGSRLRAA